MSRLNRYVLDLSIRVPTIFFIHILSFCACGNVTSMVQWRQVSPRGWGDELGCGIVFHLDDTLITAGPGEKAPSGPDRCTAEGIDH